jgi:hypothetical protein
MSDADYRAFLTDAHEYLKARQAELQRDYKIGSYPRYDWYQDRGELVFSDHGVEKVIARMQIVGDVSNTSHTWLWSWANPTIDNDISAQILLVKRYGQRHGIHRLVEAKWPADEVDGWEMAAIAAKLLHAKGAYRSPATGGPVFLIMTDVRWASDPRDNTPVQPTRKH